MSNTKWQSKVIHLVVALLVVALALVLSSSPMPTLAAPVVASVTETAFNTETTGHYVDMPATVNAGDLLIALFTNDNDSTVTTPSGWTLLASGVFNNQVRLSVYYKIAAGTEGGTTVDFVTSANREAAAQVYRITDWQGTTPPEISTAATGTSVAPDPAFLDPAGWGVSNTLWIAVAGQDRAQSGGTLIQPVGYTDFISTGSSTANTACRILSARRILLTVSSENPGPFTIPTSEQWVAFTIAVRPAPRDLTISSTEGGSVTEPGEGVFPCDEGTIVDLVATADEGSLFVRWTGDVGNIYDVNAAVTTITMDSDYSITAEFVSQYDLTISSTEGGSVTEPGEDTFTYNAGEVINLVAEADECYEFVNWTGDVDTIADVYAATTNITMDAAKDVTANFALLSRNLTTDSTDGGSVTDPGEGTFTYDCGTIVDLVATPDEGYRFDEWTGDVGTIADVYAASTNITVNSDYSITANFVVIYDLTTSSTEGGSVITPGEGVFTYDEGTIVDLIAETDACYEFVNWTGDVDTIAAVKAASTTITMNATKDVTANFALLSQNLTTDSTDGGSVTDPGEGTFTYDCGTVVDLVAEADECYEFISWTGDVDTIADIYAASTNITMDENKVVTATFAPIDCDYLDYYDAWEYYCVDDEVWMHHMFHDFSCVDGSCVEVDSYYTDDQWYEDCPTDYYTDWAYYCDEDSIWRTRDLHDFYCFNGTCLEDVIPESEWYEDCPADYYTEWVYYCDGDSIWRTRDFHDFYCLNGTCQEDVIPESEWVEDCPADYYTEWVSYCDGDSIWRTRDLHDFYCFNGTCQEDVIPESELVEDCNLSDYYDAWEYYCVDDEVWMHHMFHDFSCVDGSCVEVASYYTDDQWYEDCPTDYYTDWAYYCDGDSIWRTRDLHDFYCFNGTCLEDVIPESEWYEDCPADYYTEWAYYCDGDSVWRTRDFHDFYCLNGTCQEDVIPESEWYEDCPADYYTDWVYYCDGDSIWRTRDFHDFYCLNGTCLEDVIPESEWYEDCPADYYTEWVYYCDGDSVWRTRDFHDFYCFDGTCLEDVIPESEWYEDCPADYYTEWVYYCDGDSVWRTRDFHDFYCLNGTCLEDVVPENEWYADCDDGDPCTIDTCVDGECVHTPLYADILEYYRGLYGSPDVVDLNDLIAAANDWLADNTPPCFDGPITLPQLIQLANEWLAS
jgi:hypothetical protein